jgi:2-oxoglutarate ferredoxin oxidoreductase subunit alpha
VTDTAAPDRAVRALDRVVLRFAGDSGEGMQLTGDRFTAVSALFGNDLSTLPNYPSEIRAPAGTVAGVSAFQVHISDHDILTPGGAPNVLVAMNPAALRANLADVVPGGTLILNGDAFEARDLDKAGYASDPRSDGTLDGYTVYQVPMTSLTVAAAAEAGARPRDAERAKNFFCLGLVSWLYSRPVEPTLEWIGVKFGKDPVVVATNTLAFKAGYNFGETAELFETVFEVPPAPLEPGTYTNVTGNVATAWGLVAAGQLAKLPVFLGSYPITPATDILHELSKLKHFGVRAVQAEDEIAGIGAAIGAAFGGHLAVTTTSGPGLDLKAEMLGLAVSLELPLVVVDVQRGGPSTGLPTKTEQSDLLLAMYGRNGEAPVPIVAPSTPADCFEAALDAARIALTYRTPVFLLSDGYLANGSEPWLIPQVADLPDISVPFTIDANSPEGFLPYLRDPETLARPWAVPGTPGLMHRIGGLEKADGTGAVSYEPANHERMSRLRAAKIAGIAADIPDVAVDADDGAGLLVLGWGSTYGAIGAAVRRVRAGGGRIAWAHLTHLNPFPPNLGDVLRRYPKVLVPELNLGQLTRLVRAEFLVDARPLTMVRGLPFVAADLEQIFTEELGR